MQIRHGDLLIETVASIPTNTIVRSSGVLAEGEVTGHVHRVHGATVLERSGDVYVRVESAATVTHEEHATVTLPPGQYVVHRQREYDPYEQAARRVTD